MNTSPTATTYASPDVAPSSSEGYFECPKCHRHCKSRTWFLKHLETCYKSPTYHSAGSSSSSPVPASGEASAGPSPAQHPTVKAPRSNGAGDDGMFSPVFESMGTSSPASSTHSHQEVQSRKISRLKLGGGGVTGEANNDVPLDLSDSSVSPNAAAASRASALAFSFKHSHSSDVKSPYGNADDASSRSFGNNSQQHHYHHHQHQHSSNRSHNNDGRSGEGGSCGVAPVLSHRGSASQGSSSYVGSPLGLRAGPSYAESGSAGLSNQRPSAAASAPAMPAGGGGGSAGERTPRHAPARQGSFRLHSDGTWTQYTPTTSSSSDDDAANDGAAAMNGGDSFLAHSGRQSSKSLSRSAYQGPTHNASNTNALPHQHNGRRAHSRDTGSLSFNAGSRLVSPSGPDTLSEPFGAHERRASVGSNRNESAANPGGALQGRHPSFSLPGASSLPRDHERLVPRLVMNAGSEYTPLDRKGSGTNFGSGVDGGGFGGDRMSRSGHGSASPATLSRMSSSASPMFAQAMASPTTGFMGVGSPFSGGSGSRVSGMNGSVNNGSSSVGLSGARTPRQSERSGAVTPRAISFQRGRAVGSGGFGTVYQAILSDGSLAAVKELKLENTNLKAIDREVRAMSSLPPHPNCVRYLGSRYSAHHYYIIMEYISGGSINSLRKSVGRFRESVFQRYAYMVLLGLSHLHTHGIVHRDIKGANVLLDESGCAKIVDFGCSRDLNQNTTTLSGGGTPLWMAPEVCRGEPATDKSDVWAFGCLCLEMTNNTGLPWNFPANMTLQGVVYALACAKSCPPIPTDLSPEAQDFLRQCMQVDPEERATVAELLHHPFFDVDLMEDSDEDELLSSCPQSTVKRVARQQQQEQARRSSTSDVVAALSEVGSSPRDRDDDGRGSPLLPGLSLGARSPRASQHNMSTSHGNDGDLVVVSQSTHSKSPSGPRLDHYPRSVNVGFSLQAVDDDDDEEDISGGAERDEEKKRRQQGRQDEDEVNQRSNRPSEATHERSVHGDDVSSALSNGGGNGGGEGMASNAQYRSVPLVEEPSAFGSISESGGYDATAPPVIASTTVPTNRLRTPSVHSMAILDDEDEDEYTQMITEIITQAREAYTDEERRMTERRRRHNVLYPDSDDDDGSFSDTSGDTSAGERRNRRVGAAEAEDDRDVVPSPSARSSRRDGDDGSTSSGDTASTSDASSSSDDEAAKSGGPERHRFGATWRAVRTSSSPVIPVNQSQSPVLPSAASGVVKTTTSPLTVHAEDSTTADSEEAGETSAWGATASRRYAAPPKSSAAPPSKPSVPTHVDPISILISTRSTPSSSSLSAKAGGVVVSSSPQQPLQQSPTAQSTSAHRPPPRHHTPVSPPPPSSVFRDAAPREATRDTRPSVSIMTPPKGVVAASSGTPLSPSDPGGPGRPSVAASHQPQRLSPSVLPLSTSADTSRSSAVVDDHRSPRTPQAAPALTVGGPSRQSPQGRLSTDVTPTLTSGSVRHSPDGAPVEWYTGASARLERSVPWQSGAAAEQPKELSMAQKEMQEMLEWGRRNDQRPSSAGVTTSSTATVRRTSRESGSDVISDAQRTDRHRHHHHSRHSQSEDTTRSPPIEEDSKGLSSTENVDKKRKHLGLGIFRSRKSK